MKEFIEKHKFKLMMFICLLSLGIAGASSLYTFSSDQVSYDNTASGISSNNVQDAIDELYDCATDYQTFKSDILDAVYPVGSIYIQK